MLHDLCYTARHKEEKPKGSPSHGMGGFLLSTASISMARPESRTRQTMHSHSIKNDSLVQKDLAGVSLPSNARPATMIGRQKAM
jgi:hypothetical protein